MRSLQEMVNKVFVNRHTRPLETGGEFCPYKPLGLKRGMACRDRPTKNTIEG